MVCEDYICYIGNTPKRAQVAHFQRKKRSSDNRYGIREQKNGGMSSTTDNGAIIGAAATGMLLSSSRYAGRVRPSSSVVNSNNEQNIIRDK